MSDDEYLGEDLASEQMLELEKHEITEKEITKRQIGGQVVEFLKVVSGAVATLFAILSFTRCTSDLVSDSHALKEVEAESEAKSGIAAMENGYEQVRDKGGWGASDDKILWKKKEGTSFVGDEKARKDAVPVERTH